MPKKIGGNIGCEGRLRLVQSLENILKASKYGILTYILP